MPIPEFITRLRSRVGTDLLWMPGVTAAVLDGDRALLGQRADTGRWALISGILEPGEQPAVGIVREVAEETAVETEVVALTSVTAGGELTYPNGDRAQYLDLTFWCRPLRGEPRVADDESLAVGWFDLDALPADLTPTSRERLRHALEYRANPGAGPYFVR